jgi:hypothetical protein
MSTRNTQPASANTLFAYPKHNGRQASTTLADAIEARIAQLQAQKQARLQQAAP